MVKFTLAAVAVAATLTSSIAFADELTVLSPEALSAPVYGSSDVVVAIPQPGDTRIQTVEAVEYKEAAVPTGNGTLDMSGADGTLRACYENGGIAKQRQDFSYFCNYEKAEPQAVAVESRYSLPADAESSYVGTSNIQDEALIDCVNRGGTLIQLAANEQFACAM